jgi:hypothetical protein
MYPYLFAFSYYSRVVRPTVLFSAANSVYLGGHMNALDDWVHKRHKPIYVNLFQMFKYGTIGALIGFAFPITAPAICVYVFINSKS